MNTYQFYWSELDQGLQTYQHNKILMDQLLALGLIQVVHKESFSMQRHKVTCKLTKLGNDYINYLIPRRLLNSLKFSTAKDRHVTFSLIISMTLGFLSMIMGVVLVSGIVTAMTIFVFIICTWGTFLSLLFSMYILVDSNPTNMIESKHTKKLLIKYGYTHRKDYLQFCNFKNIGTNSDIQYFYIQKCINNMFQG